MVGLHMGFWWANHEKKTIRKTKKQKGSERDKMGWTGRVHVAPDGHQWRALVNMGMKFRVPSGVGNVIPSSMSRSSQ
jgi:hypothetical protein